MFNRNIFLANTIKRFEKRFGKRKEWRGDSFNIFISWKWSLQDSPDERVSMIVQHNIKDPNRKMGNNIKLTRWDLIEAECHIFKQKNSEKTPEKHLNKEKYKKRNPKNWDQLIPY